jgi:hypothetical protein
MNRIKLSREDRAMCAQDNECFRTNIKRAFRQKWVDTHDLFVNDAGRVFALVDTETRVFFMDAMTGSLYQFGSCLTSTELKAHDLRRNQKKAETILMSKAATGVDDE